jgi:uncharacterized protein (TIGR02996 family)
VFAVVVTSASGPNQRFVFDKAEITIGRVQGNDLVLPNGGVSRRHARIIIRDNRFIAVDLRSTNGTFLNGRRVETPQVITEHDLLTIGEFQLSLEEEEGPTTEWFPAPALDPVEERLIAAIAACDQASRVVYADWLEERGEATRAEFLRIQDRLLGTSPDDPELAVGRARLEVLARSIDLEWRCAVGRPAVEGCLAFQVECPKEWGALAATGRPDLRFCYGCEKQVFYCDSIDDAKLHARMGDCVAIDPTVRRRPDDLAEDRMIVMGTMVGRI